MLGPLFLTAYRLIGWCATLIGRQRGRALRARWALRFSSWTDGGLDDDFAEELFQLVREEPEVIDQLDRLAVGASFFASRRRMLLDALRQALATGARTLF